MKRSAHTFELADKHGSIARLNMMQPPVDLVVVYLHCSGDNVCILAFDSTSAVYSNSYKRPNSR